MKKYIFLLVCNVFFSLSFFAFPVTIHFNEPNGCEYIFHGDVFYTGHGGFNGWHGEGTVTSHPNNYGNPKCWVGHAIWVFKTSNPDEEDVIIVNTIGSNNLCNASGLEFTTQKQEFAAIVQFLNSVNRIILSNIQPVIEC
jgi:hypothetical protein